MPHPGPGSCQRSLLAARQGHTQDINEKMLTTVKLARLLCEEEDKRQKIADLVTYIENNRNGLYGSRSLRDKVEAKMVVCSTGAMEKNIETVIGRRFKKHGMSWATKGANNRNLIKLRTLWYNKSDWDAFWSRQASQGVSFPPTN